MVDIHSFGGSKAPVPADRRNASVDSEGLSGAEWSASRAGYLCTRVINRHFNYFQSGSEGHRRLKPKRRHSISMKIWVIERPDLWA